MRTDRYQRFLLDDLDIRGVVTRLGSSWRAMIDGRGYPPAIVSLLGEMTAIAVTLAGQLKGEGRLSFQLRGEGPLERLIIDCDQALRFRGMASFGEIAAAATAGELLGGGQLLMTLEQAGQKEPIQSVVPIGAPSIAGIFEHFIGQSEQQPAKLLLAADDIHASAMFLQKLPDADRRDADGWNLVGHLLSTVSPRELLDINPEILLGRVFHEQVVRVFEPREATHHCPENWEKIHAMLRSLGLDELRSIVAEHGEVRVRDDLCNREYRLDGVAVERLFTQN